MRTIKLNFDDNHLASAMEKSDPVEVRKVLGYFTTWGLGDPAYAAVQIDISNILPNDHRPVEISALYVEQFGNYSRMFYMAAIWRSEEGKFSVHS